MSKSSSLSTGGGNTTFNFTCTYANAKFIQLVTVAAEQYGLTYADIQALTTQQQADWIMNNVVLYGLKRWTGKKAEQEALEALPPFDFDSTT